MRLFLFFLLLCLPEFAFSQIGFYPVKLEKFKLEENSYRSLIAYKLPFRGENYKFYGTLSYHVFGKAYADCKVHNAIVESFKISENNCSEAHFKILKGTKRRSEKLLPYVERKNGFNADFMVPMKKKGNAMKFYYRTGLFRLFIKFDSEGFSKSNKNINIDFDNLCQYIINLDNAASLYNLKIKRIVFNRHYLKKLYASKAGKELKTKNLYFAKYLSRKVNRKYDDLFHVDFELK